MNTITLHTRSRPGRWLWVLLALALVSALLALALVDALSTWNAEPVRVIVNGQTLAEGLSLGSMPPAHKVVMVGVVALAVLSALLLVLFIVPMLLLLGLLVGGLVLVGGVGLPLLAVAAVLAVVLSPLWLLVWLLVRAVRPARPSATMAA